MYQDVKAGGEAVAVRGSPAHAGVNLWQLLLAGLRGRPAPAGENRPSHKIAQKSAPPG